MCYLTQTVFERCNHRFITPTQCSVPLSTWCGIQHASFSSIIRHCEQCDECQGHTIADSTNSSNEQKPLWTIPDSAADAGKQAEPDKNVFEKIRERHKQEAEQKAKRAAPKSKPSSDHDQNANELLRSQQLRNSQPWELESQRCDSGYGSGPEDRKQQSKDLSALRTSPSTAPDPDPEPNVLEAFGCLGPVDAGRWARQRRATARKLEERTMREQTKTQRVEKLRNWSVQPRASDNRKRS